MHANLNISLMGKKLYKSIDSYRARKINRLRSEKPNSCNKNYLENLRRVRYVNSVWIKVRIIPDVIGVEYVKKLCTAFKEIYNA